MDLAVLGKSPAYWEFMKACIDNLCFGTWKTLPTMWFEYVDTSQTNTLMPFQIEVEYKKYLDYRATMFAKVGLKSWEEDDQVAILYWLRNKNGEKNMMLIAHVLLQLYLEFTNTALDGETRELGTVLVSFNTANRAAAPMVGRTKQEMMKNTFTKPGLVAIPEDHVSTFDK